MKRLQDRPTDALRPIVVEPGYYDYTEGSCLIQFGNTHVLCTATVEDSPPPHLRGKGQGWITAEYSMLPRSSPERIRRERQKVGGRTTEIQRLVGRAMRSICSRKGWGERTMILDCDVLRADGGTRTASITGAFIAMVLAFRNLKKRVGLSDKLEFPIKDYVSAISVGIVEGTPLLDINYAEDSNAETDMNLVMTQSGAIVEIQGTAEKEPFSEEQFQDLMTLAKKGCSELCTIQREILGPLDWGGGKPG